LVAFAGKVGIGGPCYCFDFLVMMSLNIKAENTIVDKVQLGHVVMLMLNAEESQIFHGISLVRTRQEKEEQTKGETVVRRSISICTSGNVFMKLIP